MWEIVKQIASALVFLHSRSPPIVHSDVKPENILVQKTGEQEIWKLADFGLAKLLSKDSRGQYITKCMRVSSDSLPFEIFYN